MNGHTTNDFNRPARTDDHDGPEQTDIECPFCGHYTEWLAPAIYCDNCEVYWTDAAQVERDRRDLAEHEAHDEHTDAYMFDRSLRNIGGMLR